MTIKDFKELTKGVSPDSELMYFPEGSVEDEDGKPLLAGIGYFDMEEHELVYLGDISITTDDNI